MSPQSLHHHYRLALTDPAASELRAQLPILKRGQGQVSLLQWLQDPPAQVAPGPGKVPLSLAHKRLCGLLLMPLACQWLRDGQLPSLRPEHLSLEGKQGFSLDPGPASPDDLIELMHFINRYFREHKLPPRIIASNSAVYLAAPWTRLGMTLPALKHRRSNGWLCLAMTSPMPLTGPIWNGPTGSCCCHTAKTAACATRYAMANCVVAVTVTAVSKWPAT